MIRRTSREYMIKMIKGNPNWNVLDLGCGTDGWKCANMYCDVVDCTKHYSEGVFVQSEGDKTPFADKEFDFVIATHIAEHVPDPKKFMAELMRISKRGYIETPTPFFDNLVVGNGNPIPHGHLWWVTFDDDTNEIVFKPRIHILSEVLTPGDTTTLTPFFEDVMVTRLYWEDDISIREEELIFTHIPGNSSPNRKLDLRNKEIPNKKWRINF